MLYTNDFHPIDYSRPIHKRTAITFRSNHLHFIQILSIPHEQISEIPITELNIIFLNHAKQYLPVL